MTWHIRLVLFAIAAVFALALFVFLRRRHLRPEYALTWLAVMALIVVLGLWPRLVNVLVMMTGMAYQSSVILLVFLFIALMFMHVSLVACRQGRRIVRLSQEVALLRLELEGVRGRQEAEPPPGAGPCSR